MILEDGECLMMTAYRSRRANGATTFSIHVNMPDTISEDTLSKAATCAAKLHASFMGTEYRMVWTGTLDSSSSTIGTDEPHDSSTYLSDSSRIGARELGAVMYAPNIIGTKGPRKMTVVLPKLVTSAESSWELQTAPVFGGLIPQ